MPILTWFPQSGSVSGTTFMSTSLSGGADATASVGWAAAGVTSDFAGRYSDVYANIIRQSGSFSGSLTALPTGSNVISGNGWLLTNTPIIGTFDDVSWYFQTKFLPTSGTGGIGAKASIALYKSVNKDGSNGSLITTQISSSETRPISSGSIVSASFSPGKIVLNNEYLFLLEALTITFIPSPQIVQMVLGSTTLLSSSNFTAGLPMIMYSGKIRGGKVVSV